MPIRLFLEKIMVSVFATILLFFVILGIQYLDYAIEKGDNNRQVEFYGSFMHVDDPLPKDAKEGDSAKTFRWFVYFMREASRKDVDPQRRLSSIQNLNENYDSEVSSFRRKTGDNPVLMSTLLFDKSKILELIRGEEQKKKEIIASFHPMPTMWSMLLAFQWISIGWFTVLWASRGGWSISYFPFRAWWFYLYLAFMLPASLLLVGVVAIGEAFFFLDNMRRARRDRFRATWQKLKAQLSREKTYNDLCASINKNHSRHRGAWVNSFSQKRVAVRIRQETNGLEEFLRGLHDKSEELKKMQRDYFARKALIQRLENVPDMSGRLEQEFDELSVNPSVKALEVNGDSLVIYTDVFSGSGGRVGPFQIKVSLVRHQDKEVFFAAPWARRHPRGGGERGDFCFGNANELILKLLKEYRVSEAAGLMFQAFRSN